MQVNTISCGVNRKKTKISESCKALFFKNLEGVPEKMDVTVRDGLIENWRFIWGKGRFGKNLLSGLVIGTIFSEWFV